jgi:GAF domain-containing protein
MLQAVQAGQSVQVVCPVVSGKDGETPALSIPLKVRDQVIGAFTFRKGESGQKWRPEEVALLENLTDELCLALENARLYQETQRRAAREQMLSNITANFARSLDLDTILQTAVEELGQSLPVREVSILVGAPPPPLSQGEGTTR